MKKTIARKNAGNGVQENFFHSSPHAVAALGPEGKVLRVNAAFTEMFGYTPDEAEGANLDDLVARGPEYREACSFTKRAAEGDRFDFIAFRHRKDGTGVRVRCFGVLAVPAGGNLVDYAIYEDLDRLCSAENAPSDDAARLDALLGGAPIAVAFVEAGGRIRQVNAEFLELFGYTSEEVLGKCLDDLVVPEDLRKDARAVTRRADRGETYRIETRRRRKDGTVLPVLVYNVKTGKSGEEVLDFVIYLDLTETRQSERVQREAADRMKRIFKAIPDAVVLLDALDGKIVDMNDRAQFFSGYPPEEMRNRSFLDLGAWVDPADREKFLGALREEGSIRDLQTRFRRKDGSVVHCLISGEVIQLDGTERIIGIAKDITERVAFEEALRREKAYFENLFHHSPEAVVLADGESRIRRVNRAFLDLFGLEAKDARPGTAVDDLIAPREVKEEAEGITREVSRGGSIRTETVRYRKDGTPVDVFLQGVSFPVEGDGLAVYGIYQDIRERKATEKELRETVESMRQAWIDTIQALASTVEFRDPYTSTHQKGVSRLSALIGDRMGLSSEEQDLLLLAGLVHDIGKLGIPAEILNKPCSLSVMETRLVQMHAEVGFDILKKIRLPWPLAEIVLQHHERLDGSGYPRGIAGTEILLQARILAVADVLDAMLSHRPYRVAISLEEACGELARGAGRLFDKAAVEACLEVVAGGWKP